jgi:hypothetical protein
MKSNERIESQLNRIYPCEYKESTAKEVNNNSFFADVIKNIRKKLLPSLLLSFSVLPIYDTLENQKLEKKKFEQQKKMNLVEVVKSGNLESFAIGDRGVKVTYSDAQTKITTLENPLSKEKIKIALNTLTFLNKVSNIQHPLRTLNIDNEKNKGSPFNVLSDDKNNIYSSKESIKLFGKENSISQSIFHEFLHKLIPENIANGLQKKLLGSEQKDFWILDQNNENIIGVNELKIKESVIQYIYTRQNQANNLFNSNADMEKVDDDSLAQVMGYNSWKQLVYAFTGVYKDKEKLEGVKPEDQKEIIKLSGGSEFVTNLLERIPDEKTMGILEKEVIDNLKLEYPFLVDPKFTEIMSDFGYLQELYESDDNPAPQKEQIIKLNFKIKNNIKNYTGYDLDQINKMIGVSVKKIEGDEIRDTRESLIYTTLLVNILLKLVSKKNKK